MAILALLMIAAVLFGAVGLCLLSKLSIFDAGRSLDRLIGGNLPRTDQETTR